MDACKPQNACRTFYSMGIGFLEMGIGFLDWLAYWGFDEVQRRAVDAYVTDV